MKKNIVFLLVFVFCSSLATAREMASLSHRESSLLLSPVRTAKKTFSETFSEKESIWEKLGLDWWDYNTPVNIATSFELLNYNKVTKYKSYKEIEEAFFKIRDDRFLDDPDKAFFKRRISWLYPDDGCYIRAENVNTRLLRWGYPMGAKVFIFGNLNVETSYGKPFIENNSCTISDVSWWYHVAVIVSDGTDNYVMDPSLDAFRPLKLQDWILKMVPKTEDAELSICSSFTYSPYSGCDTLISETLLFQISLQKTFLSYERDRMEELNRYPDIELGAFPPWKWNSWLKYFLTDVDPLCPELETGEEDIIQYESPSSDRERMLLSLAHESESVNPTESEEFNNSGCLINSVSGRDSDLTLFILFIIILVLSRFGSVFIGKLLRKT